MGLPTAAGCQMKKNVRWKERQKSDHAIHFVFERRFHWGIWERDACEGGMYGVQIYNPPPGSSLRRHKELKTQLTKQVITRV